MSGMKHRVMEASKIKKLPTQPPMRCEDNTKLRSLTENIAKNGLLNPLLIASDNVLIDGHRRLAALTSLGVKKVDVIQHNSNSAELKDAYFVAAAKDTMQINSNQYLWRYMNNASIPNYVLGRIKLLEEWMGKKYCKDVAFPLILARKHSPSTYQFIMGMYRAVTELSGVLKMRKFFQYCFNVETPFNIKAAIAKDISPEYLIRCVTTMRPIQVDFSTVNEEAGQPIDSKNP
tara:strand:- start:1475 stop:2170 length:696 start_codon:yes stop_codon:yes gene_type:complete